MGDLKVVFPRAGSGADFHDLTLEKLEGFPNQRIVLELVFAQPDWRRFFPGGRLGRGAFCRCRGRTRGARRRWGRGIDGVWRRRSRLAWRFRLDELDLGLSVSELFELGLNDRSVLRIVHQFQVVGKFRIKSDGQQVPRERNRMRLQKISSRERARAPHRLDDLIPELIQIRRAGQNGR